MYWAQALANQTNDTELQAIFAPLAKQLTDNKDAIVSELNNSQGPAVNIGGYFYPDTEKTSVAMRPSATLNNALASIG